MAFHVSKYVQWQGGSGTPVKYSFSLDANVNVVSFINQIATISVIGTVSISNYPYNSRNSWAASDFAVLVPGNVNVSGVHPFAPGTYYYQYGLPFLPDPQNGDASKMLAQFRGDTWRNDPNNNANRSSLWTKNGGLVLDSYDAEGSRSFSLNATFSIPINVSGNTTILAWDSSGADSSTEYSWMDRQVWASWFDLDYRPGSIQKDGVWLSHNRSSGTCHVYNGTKYLELRTVGAPDAMGNPPSIYHNSKWYNMARIGKE